MNTPTHAHPANLCDKELYRLRIACYDALARANAKVADARQERPSDSTPGLETEHRDEPDLNPRHVARPPMPPREGAGSNAEAPAQEDPSQAPGPDPVNPAIARVG